jgi:hypothetical protein
MAWFRKKPDPISDRARALSAEIAALEAQIKTLDARVQREQSEPRLRSAGLPQSAGLNPPPAATPILGIHEPIFEEVDRDRLEARTDGPTTRDHYNELGVRKYDLPALLRRLRDQLRGPSTTNPKLVSYLAAGGIQGLRPLRYEKRVARNRFIVFVAILLLILLGLITAFHR